MAYRKNRMAMTIEVALKNNVLIMKPAYSPATFKAFRRKSEQLNKWIGRQIISDVTATDMGLFLARLHQEYSNKTVNHYLSILRQIFTRAVDDRLIAMSPIQNIKTCKTSSNDPDPFLQHEIQALRSCEEHYPIEVALITLGIGTGLRISELMALTVESIDLNKQQLFIDLALVDKEFKIPKTRESKRVIELCGWTLSAAKTLVEYAHQRQPQLITVLQADNKKSLQMYRTLLAYSQEEDRPYVSVDDFREAFFRPYCERVAVRYRGPSQFRHTYASQMLTAGVSVERIARKMGLTSTAMIYRHYGKWIVEDAPDYDAVEDAVLDRCFNGFTKLEPATIAKYDESHQCYGSDTASIDDSDSRIHDISVNSSSTLHMDDRRMAAIHKLSQRWGVDKNNIFL
ncbi:hypothetical protein HMPREF1167_02073 [Aeromonas veronii AER39]|nr:hypothetical protein HMPREF1167_02073 [Aeromonas veronii AER39]